MTTTIPRTPALVLPPVDLPPRVAALRAEVREFLAEERAAGAWVPRVDRWLSGWDERFTRELGKRGWLGMTLPVEYGGRGASPLDRYVVTEELLAAGAPVAAHWVADRQTGPALLRFGTEEQRQRFLPGIARGEIFFGIGMSEPDSGSDLASVRTRADRVDGGWELTGTKVWTSGAHRAHAFFALARSSPRDEAHRHAGLSQFIVDLRGAGVTVRPIPLLTGAHDFNEVVFDRAFVPDGMVVGEVGAGWHQVTSELAVERSGPERYLSTYPLLAALVGELAAAGGQHPRELGALVTRLWALRRMSLAVAGALESGEAPELAAAVVKDLGTRFENEVVDAARLLVAIPPDPGYRQVSPDCWPTPCCTPRVSPCVAAPTRCCVDRRTRAGPAMTELADLAERIFADAAVAGAGSIGFDAALWATLHDTGLARLTLPAGVGGSEASFADAAVVLAAAGAHGARVPLVETDLQPVGSCRPPGSRSPTGR